MRVPLSWLKEYIPLSLPPLEIARILTMAGLEVEQCESIGENLKDVVVAHILEAKKHPNADKLSIATVSDGSRTYQIVCGAPNCREGIKVALAKVGVSLKEDGETYTIKTAKIRGVGSEGMLCSERELGFSSSLFDGILELPDDLELGMSLETLYADTYFEIALTPNLGHCMSVFGVARELSAFLGIPLHRPRVELKESSYAIHSALKLRIEEKNDCPRYACRMIRNVKIVPSPLWLVQKLEKCGLRSVNNVVDATNYVLHEFGHPLHAFDYAKLSGEEIVVRKAKQGEKIRTLDDKERMLSEDMLLICDARRPAAIAGIMGGLESEIDEHTTDVVLEVAYFDPMSVRKTSKKLGLQTESSKRFERGTDPNVVPYILDRAAALIQEVAGGDILSGTLEMKSKTFAEIEVTCRLSRINLVIGRMFSRGEVEDIFRRLQFSYQWDGSDVFTLHIPTYRCDITGEIDLIEEVARLYGYDNIPRKGKGYLASKLPSAPIYLFEREVTDCLIREGLQEFLTCDLIGPSLLNIVQCLSKNNDTMIKVLNPTSVEQSLLRTSLLPGLLQVVKYNFDHQNKTVAGFEVGQVHFLEDEEYREQSVMGIVLTGQAMPSFWNVKPRNFDFFDLKGIVENLLTALGIHSFLFKNLGLETFHSGRQASIFVDSLEIGSIGEIHPAIQRGLDVPQRILFGEFNLADLMHLVKPLEKVEPLAIYPCSERDWTVSVKKDIPYERILQIITDQQSALLEEVSLKDIYSSDKLPLGYHNLTLHFVYRDCNKTIEQDVVEAEQQRLTMAVMEQLKL